MQRTSSSTKSRNTRHCFCNITSAAHCGGFWELPGSAIWLKAASRGEPCPWQTRILRLQEQGCYEKCSSLLQCSLLCLDKVMSQASSESSGFLVWGFLFCCDLGVFWVFCNLKQSSKDEGKQVVNSVTLPSLLRLYISHLYSANDFVNSSCNVCMLGCLLAYLSIKAGVERC